MYADSPERGANRKRLGIAIGGTVAWFITRSNLKCKKFISAVFVFPYMMPAWTLALFWTNMYQNS